MAKDPEDDAYDVGYRKPPKHSQYKKGVSGNPFGRPSKKDKEPMKGKIDPITDVILGELCREVNLKEGSQTIKLSTLEAITRSLNVGAIKGNRFQQKIALEIGRFAQLRHEERMKAEIETVEAYKERWKPRFEKALNDGRAEPRQLPHPAHVQIDRATCRLKLSGPDTPELKELWEEQKYSLRTVLGMVNEAKARLACKPENKSAQKLVAELQKVFRNLEKQVLPGWNWREVLGWEGDWERRFMDQLLKRVAPPSESLQK